MLARVDPREQEARAALRAWSARARTYAKTNVKQMVIFGGVSFAVAWVLNVWVMASVYDGFRTPTGAPATGTGNFFQGTLFYFFVSALISSTISYRLLVGSERFWREVYAVPANVKRAFTSDGDQTLVHVLVGFSTALLLVLIVGPSTAWVLAVLSLLAFTPVLRPIVSGALLTGYRWIVGRVAPKRTAMPPTVGMMVGVVGSSGAFVLGGILPGTSALVVWLVSIVAAVFIAQRRKPSASAILLALGGGVLAYWFGDVAIALADDGGMAECGNPGWSDWWSNCTGAGTVRDNALIGAGSSAVGGVVGSALGGSADTDGDGRRDDDDHPPRFEDLPPGIQNRILIQGIRRDHPDWDVARVEQEADRRLASIVGPRKPDDEQSWAAWIKDSARYTLDWWADAAETTQRRIKAEASLLFHYKSDFWSNFREGYIEDMTSGDGFRRAGLTVKETATQTWDKGEALATAFKDPDTRAQVFAWLMSDEPGKLAKNPALAAFNFTADELGRIQVKLQELERASAHPDGIDHEAVSKIVGDFASDAELGAILGKATEFVVVRGGSQLDELVDGAVPTVRPRPDEVPEWRVPEDRVPPWQEPDFVPDPRVRDELVAKAKLGEPVELTPELAAHLGIEPDVVREAWEQSLRWSTDVDGIAVEFKMGNLKAFELRQTGDYHFKPNYVADKSLRVGEEEFFPREMLENPPKPGQVVNYEPTHLPPKDHPLYERIQERMKQADSWPDSGSKLIDPYDPVNRERYGLMYDEVGQPVDTVELYKGDNGEVSMRFQRKDGSWSETKAIAGDSDTFRLEGQSDALTPAQRERLGFQAGGGTIPGDGDFDKWVRSNYSEDGLNAGVDEGLLLKQYQVGKQAMDEPVIRVTKDGPVLVEPDISGSMGSLERSLNQRLTELPDGHWDDVIRDPASDPKKAAMYAQLKDLGFRP